MIIILYFIIDYKWLYILNKTLIILIINIKINKKLMNELETNVYINICIYTYNIYIWMINHRIITDVT